VLSVLPTDPYEQLKLAHRIGCRAFSQKVASLESEVSHLKRELGDKGNLVRSLETRLTSCQLELQEALDKARPSTLAPASHLLMNPEHTICPREFLCQWASLCSALAVACAKSGWRHELMVPLIGPLRSAHLCT
jgi:hypothetical protein